MATKYTRYIADFETTAFEGQSFTEVWAAAIVSENSNNVFVCNSIDDFFIYLFSNLYSYDVVYFHNLKFDGPFILNYLFSELHAKNAFVEKNNKLDPLSIKSMPENSVSYVISNTGLWYSITYKTPAGNIIFFRDSLKIIPLSVKDMGKAFNTLHQKSSIVYNTQRKAHGVITPDEKQYISNDVLVVKEALVQFWSRSFNKVTIGSNCLSKFRADFEKTNKEKYSVSHPDLTKIELDPNIFGSVNADQYIRKSYHGGWCYVNKYKQGKLLSEGCTIDVNSLYPSVMHSGSGSKYPFGYPVFWQGSFPQGVFNNHELYYFVRIKTHFKIKDGFLPFLQIKNSFLFSPTQMLESSLPPGSSLDFSHSPRTVLTLSKTDFDLLLQHYDLFNCEILDGCWFRTETEVFDEYIDYWSSIKQSSSGGMRQIAKLFLNNLYGKLASNPSSSIKLCYLADDTLKFSSFHSSDKPAVYIAQGAAITSYARAYTIRNAQKLYNLDAPGFVYADTDSLHLDIPFSQLPPFPIDDKKLGFWKHESDWSLGKFIRPKTYIEQLHDGSYNIKCAGLPKESKRLIQLALQGNSNYADFADKSQDVISFLFDDNKNPVKMTLSDFDIGLTVPGKLLATQIKGGTVLSETLFSIR